MGENVDLDHVIVNQGIVRDKIFGNLPPYRLIVQSNDVLPAGVLYAVKRSVRSRK